MDKGRKLTDEKTGVSYNVRRVHTKPICITIPEGYIAVLLEEIKEEIQTVSVEAQLRLPLEGRYDPDVLKYDADYVNKC